jgi:putative FmdB family regulatory protein
MEILQKMSDPKLTKCPKCKGSSFRREIGGGIGLSFKGDGFYITDYANPPAKKEGGSSCCPCGKNKDACS